ncbi:TetR/AcrR family transcriptional regulator [Gryllotalpicola reticulitermitis]|uniref:TetR/AcrR family transcriptional regulator n=1 Tax=Gryllotalpicola reticulitermitis TaxID=1184153 RepID=A0ABV8Q8I4_9MICO
MTAERILEAAQTEFGLRGKDGATIRAVARRAGVDPSLVLQHYGSKEALFSAAIQPTVELTADDVPAHLSEVLKVRLRELPAPTRALMSSMLTSTDAAGFMREYLEERARGLASRMTGEDSELRAAIIVSSILGVTVARHFLNLESFKGVDDDQIEALVDAWLAPLT